jgi:hypothetical protein
MINEGVSHNLVLVKEIRKRVMVESSACDGRERREGRGQKSDSGGLKLGNADWADSADLRRFKR